MQPQHFSSQGSRQSRGVQHRLPRWLQKLPAGPEGPILAIVPPEAVVTRAPGPGPAEQRRCLRPGTTPVGAPPAGIVFLPVVAANATRISQNWDKPWEEQYFGDAHQVPGFSSPLGQS